MGADGRPGADFLKNSSREVRVSPLQRLSAGSAGIQVVPRIMFALKSMDFGVFFRPESQTQTKGDKYNGKRITEGV